MKYPLHIFRSSTGDTLKNSEECTHRVRSQSCLLALKLFVVVFKASHKIIFNATNTPLSHWPIRININPQFVATAMSLSVDKFKPTRKAGLLNQAKDAISATNKRETYSRREDWTTEQSPEDKKSTGEQNT